jgi:hypothetical protein
MNELLVFSEFIDDYENELRGSHFGMLHFAKFWRHWPQVWVCRSPRGAEHFECC